VREEARASRQLPAEVLRDLCLLLRLLVGVDRHHVQERVSLVVCRDEVHHLGERRRRADAGLARLGRYQPGMSFLQVPEGYLLRARHPWRAARRVAVHQRQVTGDPL
jgi:hypothetical protein